MLDKNYNTIKLHLGVQRAVAEALADITVAGTEARIRAYKTGMITADEFLGLTKDEARSLLAGGEE